MKIKIYCVHTDQERNIECALIENDMVYVYSCPACGREIVFDLVLEKDELP